MAHEVRNALKPSLLGHVFPHRQGVGIVESQGNADGEAIGSKLEVQLGEA
jgi:hypothetical protein